MTEPSRSTNLRTLRQLLIAAFDTEELRALVSYDDTLSSLADEFAPTHPITTMVDETISWCDRRGLLPYLVQLVKQERLEKYKLSESELFTTAAEPPRMEESPGATPETLTITSPIYLDLVTVPAGEFQMGSVAARDKFAEDDEFPPHRVQLPEFLIGQHPVTNLQYEAFVKAGRSRTPWTWRDGEMPPDKENHPVVTVSWEDALAFCAWLSEETGRPFRLPTEAEWEKAARGTGGRIWPWGDRLPDRNLCNIESWFGGTTPVGHFSPDGDGPKFDNKRGCADLVGNVSEWTLDTHTVTGAVHPDCDPDFYYYKTRTYRVTCGASWRTKGQVDRQDHTHNAVRDDVGFRVIAHPSAEVDSTSH